MPLEIGKDPNRAWLVDKDVCYRCKAVAKVVAAQAKVDETNRKNGDTETFPEARKWTAVEFIDPEQ